MRRMGIGLGVGINRSNYAQGIFGAYATRVVADGGVTESGSCVDAVSGLLQSASLLLIPSGYKSGKAYAEIPTNGNGDLTLTRASTAIRTNSSGLLESMGSGVPRLSYMYGSCPALLLEPQRTNLATYSNDFTDATWVKSFTSITANTTTSPNGETNAHTFTADGTSASHTLQKALSLTSGTTYTISIFAKKGTNNFIQLTASAALFGTNFYANYDLNNGVLGTVGSSATATIVSLSNGWYRCTITGVAIATILSNIAATIISSSTSARLESNSLSTSVFIYGAQLEAGAYPTTYIPTTTATATRVADSFSRNNIYTNGLISASGGTWFVELRGNIGYTRDTSGGGFGINTNVNSLTNDNGFTFRNTGVANSRLGIYKVISSTNTLLYTTTTDTTKIAIKWNGSTADIFVNGTKQVSATTFTSTLLEFFNSSTVDVPKFIQQMALFPTPLSDTDCTTITSI